MSIRFPDLQVLFPRAGEVARTQQAMQRQPLLGQEQRAAQEDAVRQRQAQSVKENTAEERVQYERERDGSGRGRRDGRGRSSTGRDETTPGEAAVEVEANDESGRPSSEKEPGRRVDVRA